LQLLLFSSTTMTPKKTAAADAPKERKPQAPKERPLGWTNAAWATDVECRQTEAGEGGEGEEAHGEEGGGRGDGRTCEAGLHVHGPVAWRPIPRSMANPRYDRLSFHLLAGVTGHVPRQLRPRHVEVYPVAAGV
jgi:hypothetical protein